MFATPIKTIMAAASLCKLEIDDQSFSLYLLTQPNGDSLDLRAFDGTDSWAGKLTSGNLAEMARKVYYLVCEVDALYKDDLLVCFIEQVSLDEEKFKEDTLKALTRQNLGISNYVYNVVKKGGGGQMELTWKKHILTNNVKFLLGSVTLNICREQGGIRLLDFAVSALDQNQQVIGDLEKENLRLASERQGALSRLEKCANLQEAIEKDLFGKFKVVLNEKKAKIRRLMEQLSNVSAQLSQLQHSKQSTSKPAPTAKEDSGTESHKGREGPRDSDNDTDDEIVHSPSPMVTEGHGRANPPPPGPRLPVESLLGDPNEREISSPPVKRRKRNVGATSKVKGQAVELPRPPSISRSSSSIHSSEKVRVRSTSSESKKSEEDSLESDELLQLL